MTQLDRNNDIVSPPARGRGLKQAAATAAAGSTLVAPRAGAWIETF